MTNPNPAYPAHPAVPARRRFVRPLLALAAVALGFVAACSSLPPVEPAVRQALAPSGSLRVGVYPGSPSSLVVDAKTGQRAGVALNLGEALANRLAVPVQVVEFERVAQVVEAIKAGKVDFTFTNATPARAVDVDFAPVLIQLELGYLVPPGSRIAVIDDIDKAGVRIGVTQGSSSQATLSRSFRQAVVVPAASLKAAQEMLRKGEVHAYATNKAVLNEMAQELPGYTILPGRWGVESMAIAIPKGRSAALPFVANFGKEAQASGQLAAIVQKSGLRGTVPAP